MKLLARFVPCLFCVAGFLPAQTTISLNWKEFSGAVNDAPEGYGVVSANNWQNYEKNLSASNIITSSGSTSTVDFTATAPGGFDTFFGDPEMANTPMRAGFSTFNTATNPTVTLNDLSGTFSSYDIIVYVGGFNGAGGGNRGSISDGTTTYYFRVPNPYDNTLVQSTDTNFGDGADLATYVRFSGLTADTTTITLSTPVNTGVGLGGIQITGVAIPEPGTLVLLGVGLAGLITLSHRRR